MKHEDIDEKSIFAALPKIVKLYQKAQDGKVNYWNTNICISIQCTLGLSQRCEAR